MFDIPIFQVAGTAFLSSSNPHVPSDLIQKIHSNIRPYALIAYLTIVQTRFVATATKIFSYVMSFRHYVETHCGYLTASQARDRSEEFLRLYPLSENQKLLIEETSVSKKLVNILVEKPIYPKLC